MEDNTKMEVKINNMEYTIVSNESEEYVQRVALLVNKKISEVKSQNSHLSTAMLAVMAAMNLADELLKSEDSASKLRTEIGEYMVESRSEKAELDEKKLEVENLKEDMHKLEIELAKRETELENQRSSHSMTRGAGSVTQSSVSRQPRSTSVQPGMRSAGAAENLVKRTVEDERTKKTGYPYGNVIGRGDGIKKD